jgi:type 1 fimbria pilin
LLALAPPGARAACRYTSGGNTTVTFTGLPATISVAANTPDGTVLASSGQVSPANPPTVQCGTVIFGFVIPENVTYGVVNARGGYAKDSYTYDTGIAGVGYRITHPTDYLTAYPLNSEQLGTSDFSVTSGIELVKTGPITSGSTIASGKLADWRWSGLYPETFMLGNAITFSTPSCDVAINPINVTLPPVTTSAFIGVGSTSGTTPFQISLSCASGGTVTKVTMHTSAPDSHAGVVQPAGAGYAAGIGVRVLNGNMNPVVFETPTAVANATTSIPYYAQYFQTAPAVTGGNVKATVTFDIFYQ